MHYPTETLSLSNYAAYFLLLFYIPLQHTDCHLVVIVHGLLHWARIPIWRIYICTNGSFRNDFTCFTQFYSDFGAP